MVSRVGAIYLAAVESQLVNVSTMSKLAAVLFTSTPLLSLSAVQAGQGLPTHKSTPIMYLSTLYPALCSINHQNVQRQNKASNAKALHALVDGVSRVPHKYCHRKHHAFISCKVLTVSWLLLVFFQTQ